MHGRPDHSDTMTDNTDLCHSLLISILLDDRNWQFPALAANVVRSPMPSFINRILTIWLVNPLKVIIRIFLVLRQRGILFLRNPYRVECLLNDYRLFQNHHIQSRELFALSLGLDILVLSWPCATRGKSNPQQMVDNHLCYLYTMIARRKPEESNPLPFSSSCFQDMLPSTQPKFP